VGLEGPLGQTWLGEFGLGTPTFRNEGISTFRNPLLGKSFGDSKTGGPTITNMCSLYRVGICCREIFPGGINFWWGNKGPGEYVPMCSQMLWGEILRGTRFIITSGGAEEHILSRSGGSKQFSSLSSSFLRAFLIGHHYGPGDSSK